MGHIHVLCCGSKNLRKEKNGSKGHDDVSCNTRCDFYFGSTARKKSKQRTRCFVTSRDSRWTCSKNVDKKIVIKIHKEKKMKNVAQTVLAVVGVCVFALGWPIWIGYIALIACAVLSAFESKKWLSATEVLFAAITIAVSAYVWWLGLAGSALLAIWNASQWIGPLRESLVQRD